MTYRFDYVEVSGDDRRTMFIHNALCAKHARTLFRDKPFCSTAIIIAYRRVG